MAPRQDVVFGFGAHSGIDEVPDTGSLARWGQEIVPAIREATGKTTG